MFGKSSRIGRKCIERRRFIIKVALLLIQWLPLMSKMNTNNRLRLDSFLSQLIVRHVSVRCPGMAFLLIIFCQLQFYSKQFNSFYTFLDQRQTNSDRIVSVSYSQTKSIASVNLHCLNSICIIQFDR